MTEKQQHQKISGYRTLSQEEIDFMNEMKAAEKSFASLYKRAKDFPAIDTECLENGKRHIQEGTMWLVRSIAKPENHFE